jgi:putative endonuclease
VRARQKAERRGHLAETVALWFLRLKGYRLLARRFKCGSGEIDLVMRRGGITAFIEVKARNSHDAAVLAVTTRQAKRISAAAAAWMARDARAASGHCRFDIVAVSSNLRPRHIENAFYGDR